VRYPTFRMAATTPSSLSFLFCEALTGNCPRVLRSFYLGIAIRFERFLLRMLTIDFYCFFCPPLSVRPSRKFCPLFTLSIICLSGYMDDFPSRVCSRSTLRRASTFPPRCGLSCVFFLSCKLSHEISSFAFPARDGIVPCRLVLLPSAPLWVQPTERSIRLPSFGRLL